MGRWRKRYIPIVIVITGGLVVAGYDHVSAPASSSAAVWISPTGNDSTCTRTAQTLPCLTMTKAYSIAQCGDIVEVLTGSYADQTMLETSSGSACSTAAPITFQPASGASVTVAWIGFGSNTTGATDAPDNVTLKGFALTRGVNMWGDAVNVTLDTLDGGSFLVGPGTDNVLIKDSDWGPCNYSSDNNVGCWHYFTADGRSGQPRIIAGSSNVVLEGNTFHDMQILSSGGHWECIWTDGGTNVTIRRNWFYNCETNAIAFGDSGSDHNLAGTWLIENNWVGRVPASNGAFKFGGLPYQGTMVFRFNSFAEGFNSIQDEEGGNAQSRISVVGNILGTADQLYCVTGATYASNVFINDGRGDNTGCGTGKVFVNDPPYVNADAYGSADYHLSGAIGSTSADDAVATSVTDSGATEDKDQESRPAGTHRDAGADER